MTQQLLVLIVCTLTLVDTTPATVTVAAAYSKRRRQDSQILHPDVAGELRSWLVAKGKLAPDQVLFPISKRAGRLERKTCKIIGEDLKAARAAWLKEARNAREREDLAETDFLCYENHAGLFADFHSLEAETLGAKQADHLGAALLVVGALGA